MVAMANGSTNGRTNALATVSNGALAAPTLLGRAAMKIPIGGRIRAGIKVLTRRAEEVADAKRIYDAGVAAGKGFETIEREIALKCPDLKNPLAPKNVPHFTVRAEDFPNPEVARQIMELFAEDRGDGVKRLYRFPVVFPADAWQNVMPHEMVAWTGSGKRYWSEYSADGETRHCKTYEAVKVDGNGRRTVRIFGGRKTVLREENNGLCEPETCPEYQSKKCNLSGRFIFFIPGIKSISAFELPTNSFYAMQAAIERFQTIGFMRGGRISGFLDGARTPFYITKRLVEVSRIDDEGKPSRVSHWLIELEAPVDPTALLRSDEGLEALEMRATEAAALLDGRPGAGQPAAVDDDGVIDMEEGANSHRGHAGRPAQPTGECQASSGTGRGKTGTDQARSVQAGAAQSSAGGQRQAPTSERPAQQQRGGAESEIAWIVDAAAALGVPGERFEAYAEKRWGKGWKVAAGGRKRALEEVNAFADDAKGFQEKVAGELEVFS
jgi:hypothetical protein